MLASRISRDDPSPTSHRIPRPSPLRRPRLIPPRCVYYTSVYNASLGIKSSCSLSCCSRSRHSALCTCVYHSATWPVAATIAPGRIRNPDSILGRNPSAIVAASFCTFRRIPCNSQAIRKTHKKISPATVPHTWHLSRNHAVIAVWGGRKWPRNVRPWSQNDSKHSRIPLPHSAAAVGVAVESPRL
jgi:hypothetical protein